MHNYIKIADDGKVDFVEVQIAEHMVITATDLQKIAKVIWPETRIERIWLKPSKLLNGIRLINADIDEIRMNEKK